MKKKTAKGLGLRPFNLDDPLERFPDGPVRCHECKKHKSQNHKNNCWAGSLEITLIRKGIDPLSLKIIQEKQE